MGGGPGGWLKGGWGGPPLKFLSKNGWGGGPLFSNGGRILFGGPSNEIGGGPLLSCGGWSL